MKRNLLLVAAWAGFVLLFLPGDITHAGNGTIVLDPNQRFQVMNGWEAVSQAGQDYSPATFNLYSASLFDLAVNDLGINRVRVEIKNKPGSTNFDLTALDNQFDKVVLPMRQRLQARGEALFISICYVGFGVNPTLKDKPGIYSQNALTTVQHLNTKYGIVPDAWEVILEPDNTGAQWSASQVANALVTTGDLLSQNGFHPEFVGPSVTNMANAVPYADAIAAVPNALNYWGELSFHRYANPSDSNLAAIAQRGQQYGVRTAQLERIGAGYPEIHRDLSIGRVSGWQQYALAFPATDDGAQYYTIDTSKPSNPIVVMGSRTKFLRQYFKYVRRGAVRIGAASNDNMYDPQAFINQNGSYVVVVKTLAGGNFSIQGLPAGTYGIKYTTNQQYDVNLPNVTLGAGQALNASIPSNGVITIYANTGTTNPTATGTPSSTATQVIDTPTHTRTATATQVIDTPTHTRTATATQVIDTPTHTPTSTDVLDPCIQPPEVPVLLNPVPGGTTNQPQVELEWRISKCAKKYSAHVRKRAPDGKIVDRVKGITEPWYQTKPLVQRKKYYWRVRACNPYGCVNTEWRMFRVN